MKEGRLTYLEVGLVLGVDDLIAHLLHKVDLLLLPVIEVCGLDLGDMDAQRAVYSRALGADEATDVPRGPARLLLPAVGAKFVGTLLNQIRQDLAYFGLRAVILCELVRRHRLSVE